MPAAQNQSLFTRSLPALLWACTVIVLSHSSDPPTAPGFFPINDKIAHMGIYFILSGLIYWAARARLDPWRAAGLAFCAAALFGITDEWHQSFVPNRMSDLMDWVADVVGASGVFAMAWHATATETPPAGVVDTPS